MMRSYMCQAGSTESSESSSVMWSSLEVSRMLARTLLCVSMTPLGSAVVPLV